MYKSVNVNESTHKLLQKLSTQLHKPKAQVVEMLAKDYETIMREKEKEKLIQFNREMGTKIKALQLSKKIPFDPKKMDEDFVALADSD